MILAPGGEGAARLAGLDLVVFDKDGTLIDFDAMWAPWIIGLATRLEARTGGTLRTALYDAMGFDALTGHAGPDGPLATMPMAGLLALTGDAVIASGVPATTAKAAVATSWRPPDPVATARPLADLPALFGALRDAGHRIAVATTDDRAPTVATLAALGIDGLVDAIACGDDGRPAKPAPDMIHALCAVLDVEPARCAMVGDSTADARMGRAAGVGLVVGVLSGSSTREDLAGLTGAPLSGAV